MAATFRAAPADALRIVPLDLLTAIHHRRSGQTHVVASPVPEILAALRDAPMDADALLAELGKRFELEDADAAGLHARLEELVETGLVERR